MKNQSFDILNDQTSSKANIIFDSLTHINLKDIKIHSHSYNKDKVVYGQEQKNKYSTQPNIYNTF